MWAITPGNMEVVAVAIDLLGISNVDPGGWATPVYVNCTEEEVCILIELLDERDPRGPFKASATQRQFAGVA